MKKNHTQYNEEEEQEISDQQDKDYVPSKSVMGWMVCYLEEEIQVWHQQTYYAEKSIPTF